MRKYELDLLTPEISYMESILWNYTKSFTMPEFISVLSLAGQADFKEKSLPLFKR